jgi:ATP-dependent Clp protease ATP-binding subunit ClpB
MRFDKLTIKSQEVIQGAQGLAGQLGHQQIEPEHLLKVMLEQSEGIARSVLQKLGAGRGPYLSSNQKGAGWCLCRSCQYER